MTDEVDYLANLKSAKIIKPKPNESYDKETDITRRRKKDLKYIEINERIGATEMVTYNVIKQIGLKLKHSDIETISFERLCTLLRKATNVHGDDQLKHYIKILKEDGFIRFGSDGLWHIVKDEGGVEEMNVKIDGINICSDCLEKGYGIWNEFKYCPICGKELKK